MSPVPCEGEEPGGIRVVEPPGAHCRGVGFLELDDGAAFDVNDVTIIDSAVIVTGTAEEDSNVRAAIWLGTLDS